MMSYSPPPPPPPPPHTHTHTQSSLWLSEVRYACVDSECRKTHVCPAKLTWKCLFHSSSECHMSIFFSVFAPIVRVYYSWILYDYVWRLSKFRFFRISYLYYVFALPWLFERLATVLIRSKCREGDSIFILINMFCILNDPACTHWDEILR